jgi:hypothetical protein
MVHGDDHQVLEDTYLYKRTQWELGSQPPGRDYVKYSALYYPYANVRSPDLLNRSILLYDHLFVIYPVQRGFETALSDTSDAPTWEDIRRSDETSQLLEDEGFLKVLSPEDIIDENAPLFKEMLEEDRADAAMWQEAERSGMGGWVLHGGKIPPNMFEASEVPMEWGGEGVRMPFLDGESIMITHAAMASAMKGLTPVTDSGLHRRFFSMRLRRGRETFDARRDDFEASYSVRLGEMRTRSDFIEKKLVEIALPDIQEKDPSKVLNYRDDHKEELARFKLGLAEISKRLEELERLDEGASYGQSVAIVIEDVLRPSYEKLREDAQFSLKRFIFNVFDRRDEVEQPLEGLGLKIFGSLPSWVGLLTNTGWILGSEAIKEEVRRRQAMRANPLTYLLKAEKELTDGT